MCVCVYVLTVRAQLPTFSDIYGLTTMITGNIVDEFAAEA